jgi:hypothetical protein
MKAKKMMKKSSSRKGCKYGKTCRCASNKSKSSKVKKLIKLSKGGKMAAKKKHKKK